MGLVSKLFVVALAASPSVMATIHTMCYRYFLEKDGCVFSAADGRNRCDPDGKSTKKVVGKFEPGYSGNSKRAELVLDRRYTTTTNVVPIEHGPQICGRYDNNQPGACLWRGIGDTNPADAGWVNRAKTSNCRKQLYVQRVGRPDKPIYIPVLEGCDFGTRDPAIGCFQIALTNKSFYDLEPTAEEIRSQSVGLAVWDYNNLYGRKSQAGPV